ncbi:hypothetical protein MKW98_001117 [Papaver atlanticum]|uniref:Uncharacterized protein n=1 Tax=Papaver atlanticum TaxID=357466 RepID=A0AAD4SSS9_9MAGN|nr:hypothetical protein MKW98_001117 [Papaver atlanticum]
MEPVTLVVDKLKGFAKSSEDLLTGILHWNDKPKSRNPREAFSDLMKLRDRQDKVERVLSFYKATKGQEVNTRVRGEVDVVGSLLFLENADQQTCDSLNKAGMQTGIGSRFTFETIVREKDALMVEFTATQNGYSGGDVGSPLSLSKVMYSANVSDWLSAVVIPVGAQCKDIASASNVLQQERSLTDYSFFGSPNRSQLHNVGAGAGAIVKRSNITATLAGIISGGMQQEQLNSVGIKRCFSTLGQVLCQITKGTKLTLIGVHNKLIRPSQQQDIQLNRFTVPFGGLRNINVGPTYASTASPLADNLTRIANAEEELEVNNSGGGSIAVMVDSELDENTRIGSWFEMQNSTPAHLRWGVTMFDNLEAEDGESSVGWGLGVGGSGNIGSKKSQGGDLSSAWDHHFQVEAFLKMNMACGANKKFSLQPGLVYVMDGTTRLPALMLRSNWSL